MLARFVLLCGAMAVATPGVWAQPTDDDPEDQTDDRRYRTLYVLQPIPGGTAEKAMIAYHEHKPDVSVTPEQLSAMTLDQRRAALKPVADMMVEVYNVAGGGEKSFKNVAHLIAKGIEHPSEDFKKAGHDNAPIPDAMSVLMAHAREMMIDGVLETVMNHPDSPIGEPGSWKVLRSDSGNTSSGMKSDLDQTLYVLRQNADGRWVHDPAADRALRDAFNNTWGTTPETRGLNLTMLDIATIEGRNRFPDPRAHDVNTYKDLYQRTVVELRNTPGAYTTYGAVLQQMQLRALAGIVKGNNPRMGQVYGHDEGGKNWSKQPDFDPDLALSTLFGSDAQGRPFFPQLIPGLAFGAAVANFLELEHYMDAEAFATKYHLRTWDDALFTRKLVRGKLADGGGEQAPGEKREYTDLTPQERARENRLLLGELFGGDAPAQTRHALAMDISADMRLYHKGEEQFHKIGAFDQSRIDQIAALRGKAYGTLSPDLQKQAMFDALARELFPNLYRPDATEPAALEENRKIILDVEQQHRRLAREFSLRAIFSTSDDMIALLFATEGQGRGWVDPDALRHLVLEAPEDGRRSSVTDAQWKTIQSNLHAHLEYTLLYALYDMSPREAEALIAHMKKSLPAEHHNLAADLDKLYERSQKQGWEGFKANKDVYARYYAAKTRTTLAVLSEQVQRHTLMELGFDGVEDARMAGMLLSRQDLAWNWRKAARNTVWDPGSLDAIAQVTRTFFESGGDESAVMAKILDEMVLALPVVGQAESARRGGVTGVVLIGLAMKFPPVGGAMLVYSIGEAGYAIYDLEYTQPAADNVLNAVYRGFAGPELRVYGETDRPAPLWNDVLEAELKNIRRLKTDSGRAQAASAQLLIAGNKQQAEVATQRAESLLARYDQLQPRLATLEKMKADAEAFARDPSLGGLITGAGAHTVQNRMEHYLLADVTPRLGFFVKSTIDLSVLDAVSPDTAAQLEKEIAALPPGRTSSLDAADVGESSADRPSAALAESYNQQARWLLREKYRKAKAMKEKLDTQLELRYRFRQDSLYPWFTKTHGEVSEQNVGRWVDAWFEANQEALIRELITLKLLDEDAADWQARRAAAIEDKKQEIMRGAAMRGGTVDWDRIDLSQFEFPGPPIDLGLIKARVLADLHRSQRLTAAYVQGERERLAVGRRNLVQGQEAFEIAAARPNAAGLAENEDLQSLLTALRWAAAPRHRPRMTATLYQTPSEPPPPEPSESDADENDNADPPEHPAYNWSLNVRLSVDPTLYYPPYNTEHLTVVSPAQAERAIESGRLGGVPLLEGMDRTLRELLDQNRALIEDDRGRFILVSAFAPDMADLSSTPTAAYAHLPSAKSRRLADLPADRRPQGRTARGYLMAQSIGFVDTPPLPEPEEEEEETPTPTTASHHPPEAEEPAPPPIKRVVYVVRVEGAGWVPHWAAGSWIWQGSNTELIYVPRDEQPEPIMEALRDRLNTDPCEAMVPGWPGKHKRPMIWNSGPQITLVDGPLITADEVAEAKKNLESAWTPSEEDGPSLYAIKGRAGCN